MHWGGGVFVEQDSSCAGGEHRQLLQVQEALRWPTPGVHRVQLFYSVSIITLIPTQCLCDVCACACAAHDTHHAGSD